MVDIAPDRRRDPRVPVSHPGARPPIGGGGNNLLRADAVIALGVVPIGISVSCSSGSRRLIGTDAESTRTSPAPSAADQGRWTRERDVSVEFYGLRSAHLPHTMLAEAGMLVMRAWINVHGAA